MKTLVIGIMSPEQVKEREEAIAWGEYQPKDTDPTVWFPSIKSLAEVLSEENRNLLRLIHDTAPESVTQLAQRSGRTPGNLSRTLKTLANYGLVEMQRENRQVRPVTRAVKFRVLVSA